MRKYLIKNFLFERALTTSMACYDLIFLIYTILSGSNDRFLITFYTIRLFFYFLALIFFLFNKLNSFYFPALSEIPEVTYWRLVFFTYVSLRVIFLNNYIKYSPVFSYISYGFLVTIIGVLLMAIQSRPWDVNKRKQEEKYIYHFIGPKKANLSKDEYEAVKPLLISQGKKKQRKPLLFLILYYTLSIICGLIIGAYAKDIVNLIISTGLINPSNILPPY